MENKALEKSLEAGDLGILHIRSLYIRKMEEIKGNKQNNHLLDQLDYFVLDGLGIPIERAVEYLYMDQPDFNKFEEWIVSRQDEQINSKRIDMINDAVLDFVKNGQQKYPLNSVIDDPVFSAKEMEFWDENGYIVLKNAVDKKDCKELESAIWDHLELSPKEPESWQSAKERFWLKGFDHSLLSKNRGSNRIFKAFMQLWGTDKLFQATDRVSFNPPLPKNIKSYGPNMLHWDISLSQPVPFDLFGMLYLNDIKEDQGAFQCIAGFHKKLDGWLNSLDKGIDPRDEILNEKYKSKVSKIAANKGDLIICNHALPHGSSINSADYPRFVHYMVMYPPNRQIDPIWK